MKVNEAKKDHNRSVEEYMPEEVLVPFKELVSQMSGARRVRGINMAELHRLSGVGESTINRFEGFKANITVGTFITLLNTMDLKLAIIPKDVDSNTLRVVNEMLVAYTKATKGLLNEKEVEE